MNNESSTRTRARRLRDQVELIAANVYFAPEAHAAYDELGLPALGAGYFCSRGACMGEVPGAVVAAAFGVFNPEIVVAAVEEGWTKADRATILDARLRGATASLKRILGDSGLAEAKQVERATEILRRGGEAGQLAGHPIHAGLRSLGYPGDPWGDLWRAADLVREHRGDSHNAAWVAMGISPVEITLLTELWWRIPLRAYAPTRGWTAEQINDGVASLQARGFLDGEQFTPAGEELRGVIEEMTDKGEGRILEAIGDDVDELIDILQPWGHAIVEAKGYPRHPSKLTRY